jgi:hypothetical protein
MEINLPSKWKIAPNPLPNMPSTPVEERVLTRLSRELGR